MMARAASEKAGIEDPIAPPVTFRRDIHAHSCYDLNDDVIGTSIAWSTELTERLLPV